MRENYISGTYILTMNNGNSMRLTLKKDEVKNLRKFINLQILDVKSFIYNENQPDYPVNLLTNF